MNYSDKFLDKHRYINVEDDDWHKGVWEDFNDNVLKDYGLYAPKEEYDFSVGYCQGDGACFRGVLVRQEQWKAFLEKSSLHTHSPAIYNWAKMGSVGRELAYIKVSWSRMGGSYFHMTYSSDSEVYFDELGEDDEDEDTTGQDLREEAAKVLLRGINHELNDIEDAVKNEVNGLCRELYVALRDSMDWRTSDEAVAETLEADDIVEEPEEAVEFA